MPALKSTFDHFYPQEKDLKNIIQLRRIMESVKRSAAEVPEF